MSKVYVSSHHPDPANALATELVAAGHTVVSTWHTENGPRPAADDAAAWAKKANRNFEQIETADVFVLIASPEHIDGTRRVSGGKFVEAGYALGLTDHVGCCKVEVFTVGGVENGMLFVEGVRHAADTAELLEMLPS